MPSLRDLILGNMGEQMKQGVESGAKGYIQQQKDANDMAQLQAKEALAEKKAKATRASSLEELLDLQKKNPGRQVKTPEGYEIGAPKADNGGIKDAQSYTISRGETAALQKAHDNIMGKTREQQKALATLKASLDKPDSLTAAQVATILPRLTGETGRVAQQIEARYAPHSLRGDISRGLNYIGLGSGTEPTMNPAQIENLRGLVKEHEGRLQKQEAAGIAELNTRAPQLAPYLHKTGKLKDVVGGLGQAYSSPDTGGDSERAELEQLRALDASKGQQ